MTLSLDFSSDYLLWDLTEAVTFRSKRRLGEVSQAVSVALRGQPSRKERAPTNGVYSGYDLNWLLPGVLLGTVVPKPGDRIEDAAGTYWTILSQDYDQLDKVYACYTINLTLAFDLRDTISIYGPDTSQAIRDNAGSYKPAFKVIHQGKAARVQESNAGFTEERGRRGDLLSFEIYLEDNLALQSDYYVQDEAGNIYDITGWRNKERIDDLMVVQAERRP